MQYGAGVRKLTNECDGAFQAISRCLDVHEDKMNTIDMHLQCLEDGMSVILQRLPVHPIDNQPTPIVAANGAIQKCSS
jgi:hypothetical protein